MLRKYIIRFVKRIYPTPIRVKVDVRKYKYINFSQHPSKVDWF